MTKRPAKARLKRPRKSPWNLLIILPAFILPLGFVYLGSELIERWQSWDCPPETFLARSNGGAWFLQVTAIFFASMVPCMIFMNWIAHLVAGAFFDRIAAEDRSGSYRAVQKGLIRGVPIIAAICLPIALLAAVPHHCLADGGIFRRTWTWSGKHYSWRDVTEVETGCFYMRHRRSAPSWDATYDLIMRDGSRIDLLSVGPLSFLDAYPKIAAQLHGGNFKFDRTDFHAGCDKSYNYILTTRP